MATVHNIYFLFNFTAITDEHVELDRVMEHNHTYTQHSFYKRKFGQYSHASF